MLTWLARRVAREERGSLVVSMMVMTMLAVLGSAVMVRALGNATNVRHHQSYGSALSAADGGMADAVYRIDHGADTTFGPITTSFGTGSFTYTATKVDDVTWSVTSKGTIDGIPHTIQASLGAVLQYPYAIFTQQDLVFNGNAAGSITSYDSRTGQQNTHHAKIGSNHKIICHGGSGENGDAQDYYTPDGSVTGCDNPEQRDGPYPMTDPTIPTTTQACPTGGTFPAIVNGGAGLPYSCVGVPVTFASTTTVSNGPVIIYVSGSSASISFSDASINTGGKASDFRLLVVGSISIDPGNGSHNGQFTGVLYAPKSDLTSNGCKFTPNGSLVLNSLTCNGGPNFSMKYDDSLRSLVSSWETTNWQEIPS
jgi:hypothetical protein